MLVEYWKVAHYKKKLLKKLPKSGSSPIQFLDVFIKTLFKSFIFDPDSNGWHRSWTIAGSLASKIVRKYRWNLRKLLVQRNKIHGFIWCHCSQLSGLLVLDKDRIRFVKRCQVSGYVCKKFINIQGICINWSFLCSRRLFRACYDLWSNKISYYEPRHEPFYDYRLIIHWILSSQDRNTHYEARSDALYKSVIVTSLEKNLGWTKMFIYLKFAHRIYFFIWLRRFNYELEIVSLFNKSYKTLVSEWTGSSLTSAD